MVWTARTRKTSALILGYVCISIFFSLTTYIVYVFYSTIVPSLIKDQRYGTLLLNFIFGNWLGINIYFNYLMAWLTSPGLAKNYQQLATQYPKCRKCSMNKPLRTHHCSWCDQCILKFDHHCPWLNNCVGFYNHRYFFQFCCYMAIGCIYAGTFGFREFQIARLGKQVFSYKDSLWRPFDILDDMGIPGFITYFIFIAGLTIAFLLVGLALWHGRMIGHGVTSLERVLNQEHARQCYEQGYVFVNPYDFGWKENWKRFLGVETIGEFIRRVLWPSMHKPDGDGITWNGYNVNQNLQAHHQQQDSKPTTRLPTFLPRIPPNFSPIFRNIQYRSITPPWEQQPRPVYNSPTSYQPKQTETAKDR